MRKARSPTPEERLMIIQDCLANDKNYGAMTLKYQCSYQQVRNWINDMRKWGLPACKIDEAAVQEQCPAALLNRNCGTGSQSWSVVTGICR